MHGVLDKFFSGKTSISQTEEIITELPSITICFTKNHSKSMIEYEYESDFKIVYKIMDTKLTLHEIDLKEGKNSPLADETVYVEKMITSDNGLCYKLTSVLNNKYMMKYSTQIHLYFSDSIAEKNMPTSLEIFVTSEKNSYGIVFDKWRNGKVFKTSVDKGMWKGMYLNPIQRNYMTTNSKCTYESFYECLGRMVQVSLKGSSSQCSIFSLPSLTVCKINKTNDVEQEFINMITSVFDQCFANKPCVTLEYSGEEASYGKFHNQNSTFVFAYKFPSNLTTFYEEYFVYDGITAIGSVGGTLGMCIGFSFASLITSLINIFQRAIFKIKEKFWKLKLKKSKSHKNVSLENTLEIANEEKQIGMVRIEKYPRKEIQAYIRSEIIYLEDRLYENISNILEDKVGEKIEEKLKTKFWSKKKDRRIL